MAGYVIPLDLKLFVHRSLSYRVFSVYETEKHYPKRFFLVCDSSLGSPIHLSVLNIGISTTVCSSVSLSKSCWVSWFLSISKKGTLYSQRRNLCTEFALRRRLLQSHRPSLITTQHCLTLESRVYPRMLFYSHQTPSQLSAAHLSLGYGSDPYPKGLFQHGSFRSS